MLSLHIEANDATHLHEQIAGLVDISHFDTDAITAELRERLAPLGQVVKIVPFAGAETGVGVGVSDADASAILETTTAVTTKPPKTPKTPKTPKETKADPEPAPPAKETATAAPQAGTDSAADWGAETGEAVTVDDVRAALTAHKNLCGLVTTRQIMAEHGGSSNLVEIPEAKFPALLAKLNAATASASKNAASNAQGPDKRLKPKPANEQ